MQLITGCNGQLGRELVARLPDAIAVDRDVLDITDAVAVYDFVRENNIDVIINCAAYTAVDAAEDDVDLATKINVDGVRNLAQTGAKIIHISTDYVFDGMGHRPCFAAVRTVSGALCAHARRFFGKEKTDFPRLFRFSLKVPVEPFLGITQIRIDHDFSGVLFDDLQISAGITGGKGHDPVGGKKSGTDQHTNTEDQFFHRELSPC